MRRFDDSGQRGRFLIKGIAGVIAITMLGLVLDSFGLDLGAYVVLAAALLFVIVLNVAPFWPRRR